MATTRYTLQTNAWQDCGAAPLFIQVIGHNGIRFVVESAAPTTMRTDTHVLSKEAGLSADIGLTGNVYARSAGPPGETSLIAVSR